MQNEDDLRALAKIITFIQAVALFVMPPTFIGSVINDWPTTAEHSGL